MSYQEISFLYALVFATAIAVLLLACIRITEATPSTRSSAMPVLTWKPAPFDHDGIAASIPAPGLDIDGKPGFVAVYLYANGLVFVGCQRVGLVRREFNDQDRITEAERILREFFTEGSVALFAETKEASK